MQVSIIVPIYNVAPYIKRCLLSIVNQTYTKLDVILINDCTTDNSMEIIESFLQSQTNRHIFRTVNHDVNKGLSEARNTGIKVATGDYIYFLDSDDEIPANSIEVLMNSVGKADMVLGGVVLPNGKLYFKNKVGEYNNKEYLKCFFDRKIYTMAWNRLLSRSFVLNNKLFFKKGLVHEDNLWSYQVALHVNSAKIIETPTYIYHIRGGTLSGSSIRNIHHRNETYQFIKNNLAELGLTEQATNYLVGNNFLIRFLSVSNKLSIKEIQALNINQSYPFKGLNLVNTLKNTVLRLPLKLQYFSLKLISAFIK